MTKHKEIISGLKIKYLQDHTYIACLFKEPYTNYHHKGCVVLLREQNFAIDNRVYTHRIKVPVGVFRQANALRASVTQSMAPRLAWWKKYGRA